MMLGTQSTMLGIVDGDGRLVFFAFELWRSLCSFVMWIDCPRKIVGVDLCASGLLMYRRSRVLHSCQVWLVR